MEPTEERGGRLGVTEYGRLSAQKIIEFWRRWIFARGDRAQDFLCSLSSLLDGNDAVPSDPDEPTGTICT
ncbi:hypothetical protein [Bosea sp. ASV33]|uniref:hypothetical protein n=1 Tax=Bosea sp. ASV33 TaxID=2795106 RepID=UPI0020C0AE40|nr:hypothetical protein [Bosea sp. ASV33]